MPKKVHVFSTEWVMKIMHMLRQCEPFPSSTIESQVIFEEKMVVTGRKRVHAGERSTGEG